MKLQPWIGNRWTDIIFILMPPFFSLVIVVLFPSLFQDQDAMSDVWWVALILLIDVAHVYSTLYRTYFDKGAFVQHKNKLLIIPFLSFVAGVLLYSFSAMLFWRMLAYIAVFHFVRQQFGFMRIYSRKEKSNAVNRIIDSTVVYAATIYPLTYWHLSGDRNFNWFVKGDFIQAATNSKNTLLVFEVVYFSILVCYLVKEIIITYQSKHFNLPKNAVIIGTIVSWYFGIVYFNGDMAFTLSNVVSHGIPYMALIWLYGKKTTSFPAKQDNKLMQLVFSRYGLIFFLSIIFLLAYVEEGLWDVTLWKEHAGIFGIFNFSSIKLDNTFLTIFVPLLAVPQLTHYVIDGFIWRIKKNDLQWSEEQPI